MSKTFLPQRLEKPLTDKFHSVDEHSEELYQFLSENLDSGGRPTLDDINFVRTTDKYGRNIFRRTLADYITREKPDFPYKTWTEEQVTNNFISTRYNMRNLIIRARYLRHNMEDLIRPQLSNSVFGNFYFDRIDI